MIETFAAFGAFEAGPLPRLAFGAGSRGRIPELAAGFGSRVLFVTGAHSLAASGYDRELRDGFAARGLEVHVTTLAHEPSPTLVDAAVREFRPRGVDVVVGVGGGSALDFAKAIAALLPSGRAALDHLEEVGGGIPYEGPATPLIAAPTTAGTGSEATRNAVLSEPGRPGSARSTGSTGSAGFKRSLRHAALVPRWAVVDPDLLRGCPRPLIAADGMDALTQLLESYVSPRASAFTDALCEHGLAAVGAGLLPWYEGTGDAAGARAAMAWAAFLSGVTLAHAGLGIVHGLSSPLGAWYPIPHGVACGTLLAPATRANVAALRERTPDSAALLKFARAERILAGFGAPGPAMPPPGVAPERLVALLEAWAARLDLPRLGVYGVREADVIRIVDGGRGGGTHTNPIALTDDEVAGILHSRL